MFAFHDKITNICINYEFVWYFLSLVYCLTH